MFFLQTENNILDSDTLAWGQKLIDWVRHIVERFGLQDPLAMIVSVTTVLGCVVVLCLLAYLIARVVLGKSLEFLVLKSSAQWDDILMKSHAFSRLCWIAPVLVVHIFASAFPPVWEQSILRAVYACMYLIAILVVSALLNAVLAIYKTLNVSRTKPIKGFVDIVRVMVYAVGGALILCAVMDTSPLVFLSGIGAVTAVLLIVFRDTLLGLVASFQITSGDMVREGDWIEMPKYGADGDVIEVSLHTVKVRNWDKTITTIPTYALVSDSFKNWRGMEESGGRRIKRSICIDMNSIKFCTDEMLVRFEKYQSIAGYIREKRKEIEAFNKENDIDTSELINGRRLTNIGTLRAYMASYLRNHPLVHKDMTFLIRHLAPSDMGLPIEIYVFSKIQAWADYEAIQADIIDHLLAVLPEFELRVFQNPTGTDFSKLADRAG